MGDDGAPRIVSTRVDRLTASERDESMSFDSVSTIDASLRMSDW
jgi:hypothetical protein